MKITGYTMKRGEVLRLETSLSRTRVFPCVKTTLYIFFRVTFCIRRRRWTYESQGTQTDPSSSVIFLSSSQLGLVLL